MWGQLVGPIGTYDLRLPLCRIGRISAKADIVIPKPWISALQCTIELRRTGNNDQTVWLKDMSSNGVYVNGDIVGKSIERQIFDNDEIYFTKPSLHTPNVEPTFFRFHFANQPHSINVTPVKAGKRSVPTPDSKSSSGSAKKLCVASSSSAQRDELVVGTESMLKANQELRQRLFEAGNREIELKEQLQEMLANVQRREHEIDELREEVTKARAKSVEEEHLRLEHEALEAKYKQAEAKCVEIDLGWLKDKELLKQCQEELASALRSTLSLNNVVDVLKTELEDALSKTTAATQKVRQLEIDNQKLGHQLDLVHRTSDHEQEHNREAFRHMQECMAALGNQIEVVHDAQVDDDEAAETQCVLTERFSRVDDSDDDKEKEDDECTHAQEVGGKLADTTIAETTTLHVEDQASPPASSTSSHLVVTESKQRWLQLKKDSPVASVDDCGLFDESQDVRHQA
ncbi:hypothetical protein DYB32_009935 [Aphanomyces invadans]|uniref:FHA domain-containing protein n=1 Tax=Aphanomyces invadans TaxID=157072 RepID=A0A3R7CVM2_9STRA|nr:hypothetical protein DYB32_009935 [Aphanomyces invadans]